MSRKTEGKYKKIKDHTSDRQCKEGHNEKEGKIVNTQKKYSTTRATTRRRRRKTK
jgi:hypothetical protein